MNNKNDGLEAFYRAFPDKRPIQNDSLFKELGELENLLFGDGSRLIDHETFKKNTRKGKK